MWTLATACDTGQRTTLDVGPYLSVCFESRSLLFVCAMQARWACELLGNSSYCTSDIRIACMLYHPWLYVGSGYLKSGPHTCIACALAPEPPIFNTQFS